MNSLRSIVSSVLLAVLLCSTATAQATKAPATAAAPAATSTATKSPTTAATTTAPTPVKALSGVAGDRNATLLDRIPPEQLLTLQVGDENFPARYIGDLSGLPRGAVIILHASGQHPSWPFTVAALIDDLPLHGWSTLSIELPAPAQDRTAQSTAASPNAAATPATAAPANKAAPSTPAPAASAANTVTGSATGIEPRAQARIAAAVKYFVEQKQKNVVLLGFGSGATRAAETVRQMVADPALKKTDPITTLVLIAPANRLIGIEDDLPKILPSTELPTLDIILSSDPQALADAEARRRAVLHQRQRTYRRLELPPIAAAESAQQSLMVRRVRAWLQRPLDGEPKDEEPTAKPTAPP